MSNEQGAYSVFRSVVDNTSNLPSALSPDFNETIHFDGNKTYKELVYTSRIKETLNFSIEVLTNDSTTSRLALRNERKGTNVIPRPQNAWIIYRRDKYAGPEFEGVKSCVASVTIGERWRNERKEVTEYFVALSMLASENHRKKYGDYKYQPKPRMSKKSKDRQRQIKENVENTSPKTKIEMTDLPQFVVVPPTNEYPTPVSSITHSPVDSQNDFSEQTNNNSYFTPPSSNQHSPGPSQDGSLEQMFDGSLSEFMNDPAMNLGLMNSNAIMYPNLELMNSNIDSTTMYPNLSAITPTNDFSTYDNNSLVVPESFTEFLRDADNLLAQSSPNTSVDVNILGLYPGNETLISNNIIPPTEEETTNMDLLFQDYDHFEYDFSIIPTPLQDQLDFHDNDSHPFNE